MKSFVKSALFAGLGVGCLALGSGAQAPAPQPPTVPPPAFAPNPIFINGQGVSATAQPAYPGTYTGRLSAAGDGTHVWFTGGHDTETIKLAKQIADAKTDTDKEKLKDKLKDTLTKSFDARQKRQEQEIEALKAQVKKLEEMVAKRQDAKKEIIDDRIKQLEREAKGLGW